MTQRTVTAMAMDFVLTITGEVDDDALDTVMDYVRRDLEWVDQTFSTFRADSWISRLSRGDAKVSQAPPAVAEVLDLCEQFREETGGAFDARTPDGGIDPTGIVKTWAMERVRWRLGLLGVSGWMLACAGDAITSGTGPHEGGWRMGIADPRHPPGPQVTRMVQVTEIGPGRDFPGSAIATSAAFHAGHSIWAPRGGAPALSQASVVGADAVACDAWATAVVAGGKPVVERAARAGLAVLALAVVDDRIRSVATPRWRATQG